MTRIIGKTNSFLAQGYLNKSFMRKTLLPIILLISSLIYAQNNIGVLKTDANIRWEPSTSSDVIKVLPKGQAVIIESKKRKWSFIKNPNDGKKGWVSNSLILNAAILKTDANIRWEPSTSSRVIKVLPKGKVVIVEIKKRKWSFIKNPNDGKKGWVSNSLLSSTELFNQLSNNQNDRPNPNNSNKKESKLKDVHPKCDYQISSPINGSSNVSTNQIIKWSHGTGNPKGYYLTIAAKINERLDYVETKDDKIIRQLNIGFVSSYSTPELKPYTTYVVALLPYNEVGLAFGCNQLFSFTTGSKTSTSKDQIIEDRLKSIPTSQPYHPGVNELMSRWRKFKSVKLDRIIMNTTQTNLFIEEVRSWEGVPYKLSGTTRNGVDCSGLIWRGLRQANDYNGQRLNAQMWAQSGKLIANKNDLKPGDLICFTNTISSSRLVHHIAIYLGNNKFWHAPSAGSVVSEESLDNPYWKPRFIFGVRFSN